MSKNLKNSTSNALDSIKMHSPVGVDFPENGENVYEIDKRGAPCKRMGTALAVVEVLLMVTIKSLFTIKLD